MNHQNPATAVMPPRLTICWLRAARLVQAQMQRGCELRDEFCAGASDLDDARAQCAQWLCAVGDLLRGIVDNSALLDQFNLTFGESAAESPLCAGTPAEYARGLNAAISGLWGVQQRLEFLADPPGQRSPRWVALHLILQTAAERQWLHYYVPS